MIFNLRAIPIFAIIIQSGLFIVLLNWLSNFKIEPLLLGLLCLLYLFELFKTTA